MSPSFIQFAIVKYDDDNAYEIPGSGECKQPIGGNGLPNHESNLKCGESGEDRSGRVALKSQPQIAACLTQYLHNI